MQRESHCLFLECYRYRGQLKHLSLKEAILLALRNNADVISSETAGSR